MRRWTALVGLGVLLFSTMARGDEPASTGWQAGAARVDITPEGPVWMAGYAARKAPSEGVLQPIFAKALALRDADGRTAVLVTLDLIGVKRPLTERVMARVEKEHGLPREAVVLLTSHTHCGPIPMDTPDRARAYQIDPERVRANVPWTKALEDRIVQVVGEALDALQPARLSHGVGQADFAMNRREPTGSGFRIGVNPEGSTDHDVPVLQVADPDGTPRAIVFGYACHNTTLGGDFFQICGDYAGFAQQAIEKAHPGAVALFVAGCGGDQNPQPRGTVELAKSHGQSLADAVESALSGSTTELTGALRASYAEPTVHFAGPADRAAYESRLDDPNPRRADHARRMIEDIDAGIPVKVDYPYPVQVFALGDQLTLLALAGEVVVDYAHRLRRELAGDGGPRLWVAAYANDVFGYVPSRRVLKEGGYEGGEAFYYSTFPTPFAEDVEEIIVDAARELAEEVREP